MLKSQRPLVRGDDRDLIPAGTFHSN